MARVKWLAAPTSPAWLEQASLVAPPAVRMGTALGVPALTVEELAAALERRGA